MLKAAIKQSTNDQIRHRVIPTEAISQTAEELENLRSEVSEVLKEEKEEKAVRIGLRRWSFWSFALTFVLFPATQLRQADMEVRKGQNMIEHEAEIFSRPARTWFQSEKEKKKAQGGWLVV
jgi:ATP-dependent RNA helicase DDX27